jgi:hypothetical protein
VFGLGIKDAMFESVESEVFEMYMDATAAGSPMVSVDPSYARKLPRDLAAWWQSIGFAPHRDFAAVERIFGDVSPDASDAAFRSGRDGKLSIFPAQTTPLPSFDGGSSARSGFGSPQAAVSKPKPSSPRYFCSADRISFGVSDKTIDETIGPITEVLKEAELLSR